MKVLVTGASGLLGGLVADQCEAAGLVVIRAGRRAAGPGWAAWDMSGGQPPADVDGVDCLVHAAPLWVLPDHVEGLAARGVRRMVCFSSTSVLTKSASPDPAERRVAGLLERAEAAVRERAAGRGVNATLFRPTLIYGWGRDANVSTIARFIRRFRFFPIPGPGSGRRQPVYAGDLAAAALAVLDNDRSFDKVYELTGPETLSYRRMVERIFEGLGRAARIVRVPAGAYRALLGAAGRLGLGVSAAMADRMEQDLVFDSAPARRDFGYRAEPFLSHPRRDLPA